MPPKKGKRNAVSYVEQDEPAFLKRFKQRVGYQEPTEVDAKFAELDQDDDNEDDNAVRPVKEDEKPQVVVLKKGDLTADEVQAELDKMPKEEDKPYAGGKIVFKKPSASEKKSDLQVSSGEKTKKDIDKVKQKKSDTKSIKNKSLLSFDDEEEEEEEDD